MSSASSVARLTAAATTGAGVSAAGAMVRGAGLPRVMETAHGASARVLTSKCYRANYMRSIANIMGTVAVPRLEVPVVWTVGTVAGRKAVSIVAMAAGILSVRREL
jgi:hypothetical protein